LRLNLKGFFEKMVRFRAYSPKVFTSLLILSANCIYVYKSSIENALLDHVGEKEDSCQPMVFCMGGASDKFTYIRAKPYRSSFLDSVNLFKFYEGNRRKDIHFWRHEHGDYGTPEGKLPIRIVDTSIVDSL